MKALFFVETPHRLAGAVRSMLAALGKIRSHGIEPLALFPGPGIVEEAYRAAGIPTRILQAPPSLMLFNRQFFNLTTRQRGTAFFREFLPYNLQIARLIRDEGFEVIHFTQPRGILVAGLGARLSRRPVSMHLRGLPYGMSRATWLASQILAQRIVMVAKSVEVGVDPRFRSRATVVYNGVLEQPPRDRIASRRVVAERVGRPALATSDDALFVSLSSLTPFKGLHHLLNAAARLRDRGIRAHYVFAGGGDDPRYRDHVFELRARLGLDDLVDIIGFVPDPLALLAGADVLVLPSVLREQLEIKGETFDVTCNEGLPRSILEAMSLGVPVVATDIAGVKEQIDDGVTGYVVPPSDPSSLADALERAATDAAWRERSGAAARAVARSKFTIDASAAGLARVLQTLVRP